MNARKRIIKITRKMKRETEGLNVAYRKLCRLQKKSELEARRMI
jgi:hypothetical protein